MATAITDALKAYGSHNSIVRNRFDSRITQAAGSGYKPESVADSSGGSSKLSQALDIEKIDSLSVLDPETGKMVELSGSAAQSYFMKNKDALSDPTKVFHVVVDQKAGGTVSVLETTMKPPGGQLAGLTADSSKHSVGLGSLAFNDDGTFSVQSRPVAMTSTDFSQIDFGMPIQLQTADGGGEILFDDAALSYIAASESADYTLSFKYSLDSDQVTLVLYEEKPVSLTTSGAPESSDSISLDSSAVVRTDQNAQKFDALLAGDFDYFNQSRPVVEGMAVGFEIRFMFKFDLSHSHSHSHSHGLMSPVKPMVDPGTNKPESAQT